MSTSLEKMQSAIQHPQVVDFFRGLFDSAGVRVTDTGETFTADHTGTNVVFTEGLSEDRVDFTVEIRSAQIDLLLEYAGDGVLDDRERFRIMAVLAAPATQGALQRPAIKNKLLRSALFKIGRAESLMHVSLASPNGEDDVTHTIAYVDGQWLVIAGRHGDVPHTYRLTVDDAVEYQRKMLTARKANSITTWLAFAHWYGKLRKRVVVPAKAPRTDTTTSPS
ncbi:MAG: hypothetical protein WEB52_03110 [Dehalococcoidia bacterium]